MNELTNSSNFDMSSANDENLVELTSSNADGMETEEDRVHVQETTNKDNEEDEKSLKRKKTSSVWNDCEEVDVNGVMMVKCNHCGKVLKKSQTGATSTYRRHIVGCVVRLAKISGNQGKGIQQSLLSFDSESGNLSSYKFDKEKTKDILAKMIIAHEYPFNMVEHEFFILYSKHLNPRYEPMKRKPIRERCIKVYEVEKKKLRLILEGVGRVSLTSDLWTSNTTTGYMCLTGHFVDSEWKLQKRILNFCQLSPPHTGIVISDKIFECLSDWGIEGKISTITFDNASANTMAVRYLKEQFQRRGALYFGGQIFHVRCCAHILNLMVQDGLNAIKSVIHNVRESVKHIIYSPARLFKFNEIVKQMSLPTHMSLILDVSTRWNSTYYMLRRALIFKDVFPGYKERDSSYDSLPSEEDWESASDVCKFLELFDEVTKLCSGVHYPTSNLFFPEVWKVRLLLDEMAFDHRDYIMDMVTKMREKFDKYWGDFNLLMAIGTALDPRNKLSYIVYAYKNLYPSREGEENLSSLQKVDMVRKALYDLYGEYVAKEASGDSVSGSSSVCSSLKGKTKSRYEFELWAKKMDVAQPTKNEMDMYLEEGIYIGDDSSFNVLEWWKANTLKFRYLSKMARDILSIPITTVASESAFSAGRRVIDEYRSSLNAETVEALICAGDWLRAHNNIGTSHRTSRCTDDIGDDVGDGVE